MHHETPFDYISNHARSEQLNWLRAAVLGANDGIVSIAGLVVGIAGTTTDIRIISAAGMAGVVAGAISMAAGEYVSVSSQRDTEQAILREERHELTAYPDHELEELTRIYQRKGLSRKSAETVAAELTHHDAFAAHTDAELGIDPHDLTNPWHAAIASAAAFVAGAAVPMLFIVMSPATLRVPLTFISVLLALAATGAVSARFGGAPIARAVARVVIGGALAMCITYAVGALSGVRTG